MRADLEEKAERLQSISNSRQCNRVHEQNPWKHEEVYRSEDSKRFTEILRIDPGAKIKNPERKMLCNTALRVAKQRKELQAAEGGTYWTIRWKL